MITDEEKRLIGGSDAGSIVGVNPYSSAVNVWERIVHGVEVPVDHKITRRGELMEPVIRAMAQEEYGLKLLGPAKGRDPKRPYVRWSLDDRIDEPEGYEPAEFKSLNPFARALDNGLPAHWQCQAQFYLAETGRPRLRLFALVGVDDLREYVVEADAEIQGMLLQAVDRFHADHILTGKPPPPDASEAYGEWLSKTFPPSQDVTLQADTRLEVLARDYAAARRTRTKAEEDERRAKNAIESSMGNARRLVSMSGTFTRSLCSGRRVTDWQALAMGKGVTGTEIESLTNVGSPFTRFQFRGVKHGDE